MALFQNLYLYTLSINILNINIYVYNFLNIIYQLHHYIICGFKDFKLTGCIHRVS